LQKPVLHPALSPQPHSPQQKRSPLNWLQQRHPARRWPTPPLPPATSCLVADCASAAAGLEQLWNPSGGSLRICSRA